MQRRIAKLTKKWREAQRQADEALEFAKSQKKQKEDLQKDTLQSNKLVLNTEKNQSNLGYKQQPLN